MRKLIATIIVTLLLIPALVFPWPVGWNSIGFIATTGGSGSCVFTEKGIFSAKHLTGEEGYPSNFKVVRIWKKLDLMKIELIDKQLLEKVPVAKFIDPDKPVYYIGYISPHQRVVRYGYIMGRIHKKYAKSLLEWKATRSDLSEHIMIDIPAIPGMSGGGVFQDGKLIGITSLTMVYEGRGGLYSIMVPLAPWKKGV